MDQHPPSSDHNHHHEAHGHAVDYLFEWLHAPFALLEDRYLDAEPSDLWSRSTSWTGLASDFSRQASQDSDTTLCTTAGLTCAAFSLCHAAEKYSLYPAVIEEPKAIFGPKDAEDEPAEAIDPGLENESTEEDESSEAAPKDDSDSDYMEKQRKRVPFVRKAKKVPTADAPKAKKHVARPYKRRRVLSGSSDPNSASYLSAGDPANHAQHATYCHWPNCRKQTAKKNVRKIISDYFGRNHKAVKGLDVPWVQVCGARYDEQLYNHPRRALQLWALKRQIELWKHWDGFSHFYIRQSFDGSYQGKCTLQEVEFMIEMLEQVGTDEETLRKFVAIPVRRTEQS